MNPPSDHDPGRTEILGWREWATFPGLGIPAIKAKVDTGARTSTLHAFEVDTRDPPHPGWVRFAVHPLQRRQDIVAWCTAPIVEERMISDSGGHRECRLVIRTPVRVGDQEWEIEMSLTNRDTMLFRLLLGRTALRGRFVVDPLRSFLTGRRRYRYPEERRTP
jgi:hypothetical protein